MKNLTVLTDEYRKTLRIRDAVAIQACAMLFGLLMGMTLPKKARRPLGYAALGAFAVTYLASMTPFLRFLRNHDSEIDTLFE